jgi:hypothetical protein
MPSWRGAQLKRAQRQLYLTFTFNKDLKKCVPFRW